MTCSNYAITVNIVIANLRLVIKTLGKWWGPKDKQPILAIHGWQDNAGTFDTLVELLPNVAILCIDLPGHGFSSHLPYGQMYYLFWDGVITLRRIVKHYKWNKVSQQESMLYNDLSQFSLLYTCCRII